MDTPNHAAPPADARTRPTRTHPYAVLGGIVVAGLLVVGLLGYVGAVPREGVYDNVPAAFFAVGMAVLILAAALVYLFLTLRDTIDVGVQDRLTELQEERDGTQDLRLASLEHNPGANGWSAQLARAETRIASLERASAASPMVRVVANGPAATRTGSGVRAPKSLFGDVCPVIDVEGIGPVYAKALNGMGIEDTRQLWEANAAQVASAVDVPVSVVHKWQQMAELIAVKGIGPQYAELLQRSGVGSIAELKASKPEALLASVTRTQGALDIRIQGNTIGQAGVTHWIQAARNHHGG